MSGLPNTPTAPCIYLTDALSKTVLLPDELPLGGVHAVTSSCSPSDEPAVVGHAEGRRGDRKRMVTLIIAGIIAALGRV
jgi:hypothetical protein